MSPSGAGLAQASWPSRRCQHMPVPSPPRRGASRRWSRAATIASLALPVLAGCGAAPDRPSAAVTAAEPGPPPTSVHAPPGFSRSGCLPPLQGLGLCFTRPTSMVLTPQSFARLVRATGVAVPISQISCWREPHPTRPGFRARTCDVIGSSGGYRIRARVLSLVRSGPDFISATMHDLPLSTYALPHPTPMILELFNDGTVSSSRARHTAITTVPQ